MEHSYFLRITPNKSLSYEDIIQVIENLYINKYFICYEEASRPHYHLCLWSPRSVENLRYRLKEELNGQIYISGKQIEDKLKAIAYCMKDGNYRYKNVNILDIMSAKSISHKKTSFDDELKEIQNDKDHSIKEITGRILDLHVKYNRKIYKQHIRALVELIRLKRCDTYREILIKDILGEF